MRFLDRLALWTLGPFVTIAFGVWIGEPIRRVLRVAFEGKKRGERDSW